VGVRVALLTQSAERRIEDRYHLYRMTRQDKKMKSYRSSSRLKRKSVQVENHVVNSLSNDSTVKFFALESIITPAMLAK
jgi:hypothetical protein